MKIAYNPPSANAITNDSAKSDDIIFDLKSKRIWAKGELMGDADTVDGLHANSFVRRWDGLYGTKNKFLTFDTGKEKGWIELDVWVSDNAEKGSYAKYRIAWGYHQTSDAVLDITCIYTNQPSLATSLVAVRDSENTDVFSLYITFLGPAAKPGYYMNYSFTVKSLDFTVVKDPEIPTATYTSYLGTSYLNVNGNAATAATLKTKRKINETEFDGSKDITTTTWGTSRNITIGDKKQSVDGSEDVSWTVSDIGAAASNHTHDYLVTKEADQNTFNSSYSNFRTLYAGGGHGITGVPSNAEAFGVIQMRIAKGWSGQILYNNDGSLYTRCGKDANITKDLAWRQILDSSNFKNYFTNGDNITLDTTGNKVKISATNTWRTVAVNTNSSIDSSPLNLCSGTYVTVTKGDNGKVTFDVNSECAKNWENAYGWYKTITEENDSDNVINKWNEIVSFLKGIEEDDKLNTLLNSKLAITEIANESNIDTLNDNALYWISTKSKTDTLINRPFGDSTNPFAMLSVTNYTEDNYKHRSRIAFNDYGQMKIASYHFENTAVKSETWYDVLTSKNSGISDSTITINGNSTTWKNTWRTIKINNTSIDQNDLNLIAGTNVTLSRTNGNVTISSPNTWRNIYVNDTSSSLGSNSMTIADGTNTTASLTSSNTVKINLKPDLSGISSIGGVKGNDYWCIKFDLTNNDSDAGYLEIATAGNSDEPIYVRQYSGAFKTLTRTLTLLDGSGNTTLPGTLSTTQVKTGGGVIHTDLYTSGYKASKETDTNKKNTEALTYANKFMLLGGGETLEMNTVTKSKIISLTVTSLNITNTWGNVTGIYGNSKLTSSGTYIVQAIMDNVYYSGIMSWYTGTPSANNTDEIVLHRGGGGYSNTIYLRTEEKQNDKMYLQISANDSLSGKTVYFNFQQIC